MEYLTPIYLCHNNGQSMVIYSNQYLLCIERRLCDLPLANALFVVADNNSGSFGLLKNQKDRIGHVIFQLNTINGS